MTLDSREVAPSGGSSPLRLRVLTSPTRSIYGGSHTFSPTTYSVVYGNTEALLVDAPIVAEDVDAVIGQLRAIDRDLTHIFVTHGHADHYLGAERIVEQFPGCRVVTTPAVAQYTADHGARDAQLISSMFDDDVVSGTVQPAALADLSITVDGVAVHAIDVGQGDISPSAVLHIPDLDAVIAGDVAYNGIHAMLAFSGPPQWADWIGSTHTIEKLSPRIVVAGHKNPALDNDAARVLSQTRAYITTFSDQWQQADTTRDLVEAMTTLYPSHGNQTTLLSSASAAMRLKRDHRTTTHT